jgi:hypothetical protein
MFFKSRQIAGSALPNQASFKFPAIIITSYFFKKSRQIIAGSESVWQIPPYQTKPVMKANFVARLESNHTAYIRIKTNTTGAEFLYLPLEVEVTSQPGIYSPQEVIDFGLVPSQSETKAVKLLVLNSGAKPIQIQNVIATPVTEAISINFKAVKVQPETLRPKVIAEMVFNRKFFVILIRHDLLGP